MVLNFQFVNKWWFAGCMGCYGVWGENVSNGGYMGCGVWGENVSNIISCLVSKLLNQ